MSPGAINTFRAFRRVAILDQGLHAVRLVIAKSISLPAMMPFAPVENRRIEDLIDRGFDYDVAQALILVAWAAPLADSGEEEPLF